MKRTIGILVTIAVLAVIVLTVLRRETFHSAFFDRSEHPADTSPAAPETAPTLSADTIARTPPDSLRVDSVTIDSL